jgi:hypothetical protein
VKLYGRAKMLDKALDLVKTVPLRYEFDIDAFVYTALMAAAMSNSRLPLALDVFTAVCFLSFFLFFFCCKC